MDTQNIYLTADGAAKLQDELEDLTEVQRPALARRLREAIRMGDLSENADYIAAKEDQAFLEGKILELEYTLNRAAIIEEDTNTGMVSVGVKVTISENDGEPEVYTLVGPTEADPGQGQISNQSPIGKALMGKSPGDTVNVDTPGGKLILRIIKLE